MNGGSTLVKVHINYGQNAVKVEPGLIDGVENNLYLYFLKGFTHARI